ncbi:hypothetical protein L495_1752 [Bordetella bronchiseptica CARE970018BB]|uniref:Uncharacterized protein n=1 Tax=Bordetella bronchiseptica 00-P-2796 TaxID=1331199 RepID=A0ABR4R8K2_BORBO|nr:hypothetical protein L490_1458 [Bordetella bronchiseptica 00-P-2796]KDB80834.1 hypothetical protein L495_1752 [Bordetella bronchiseptica CARE970018BB]KDB99988.1 hypothetical protein AZ23_1742 [Bordetella bronchiseptica E010]KDC01356.1 hypothetical protein AZ18_1770 [Bordetella bronchiseptica D993]
MRAASALQAKALVLHPVGFRPAGADALSMTRFQDWELSFTVHIRAAVAPVLAASVGFGVGLVDVPLDRGFRDAVFSGYVDAQGHTAVSLASADHYPIRPLHRGGAACQKQHAYGNQQFFTYSHFLAPYGIAAGALAVARLCNTHFITCSKRRATWVCLVCLVSTPFFRKFLIRVHEKVTQKSMRNEANEASKKLHVQGGRRHAENRGGE